MKISVFTGLACASALTMPAVALAQATSSSASGPDLATSRPQAAAPDAPEAGSGIGDIIVTAQRRSENLQKVPVSVAAVSSSQLAAAGITDLQALRVVVPGLTFSSIQQNVQPRLRGIGSSTAGPGIEPGVAVYVDGVYYASSTGALFSFNNVEQISVLKGPQGTLFGRNAVAGLVQVTTRDPSQTFRMEGSVGYGNYQTLTGSFYVGGGLGEDLAVDLAGVFKTQGDGYGRNLTLDRDTKRTKHDINLRSKIVFTPGPDTKVVLSLDYANLKGTQGTNRLEPGTVAGAGTGPNFVGSVWDVTADVEGFNNNENGGGSLKIEQKIGSLNLLSLTAYRRLQYENALDLDFTATPFQAIRQSQHDRQFSQELQLQSSANGPFKWTVGLFYFDANAVSDPLRVKLIGAAIDPMFPLNEIVTVGGQKTRSIAAYGQASYTFPTNTTLTLGARYTDEKRTADTVQTLNLAFGLPSIPLPPSHSSATFRKPTFRIAVDQQIGSTLVYASWNRGFKSGGFNAQQLNPSAFKPEVLDAYEAGLKTSLFDRRMTFNAAAFYYDYRNIQIQFINPDGSLAILNGAKARAYGLDVDIAVKVTNAFQLTFGGEVLDTKFISFPNAQISTTIGGTPIVVGSVAGNDLPLASKFSGTVGGNYTFDFANGSKLMANGTLSYNSGWYTEPDNARRQPRFVQVNGKLSWTSANDRYNVSVWTENLTNAKVRTNAGTTVNGSHYVSFAPPRTYGVTVGFKY